MNKLEKRLEDIWETHTKGQYVRGVVDIIDELGDEFLVKKLRQLYKKMKDIDDAFEIEELINVIEKRQGGK